MDSQPILDDCRTYAECCLIPGIDYVFLLELVSKLFVVSIFEFLETGFRREDIAKRKRFAYIGSAEISGSMIVGCGKNWGRGFRFLLP